MTCDYCNANEPTAECGLLPFGGRPARTIRLCAACRKALRPQHLYAAGTTMRCLLLRVERDGRKAVVQIGKRETLYVDSPLVRLD
jgi:hypothetical protein